MVDAEELGAAATSANEWTEINLDSVVGTLTVVSHEGLYMNFKYP